MGRGDYNPVSYTHLEAARHDKVVHRRIISIHSPRVGRGFVKVVVGNFEQISIHSPRVGRGNGVFDDVYLHADFNPVSDTHLDVYKRQLKYRPLDVCHQITIPILFLHGAQDELVDPDAVSYTHLRS